jgi:hypothetical protein
MNENKNQEKKLESVNITTTQDKIVPKFCTGINVGLLKSKNVVLTMVYNEDLNQVAVIDRIVIDLEHARELKNVLDHLLKVDDNV